MSPKNDLTLQDIPEELKRQLRAEIMQDIVRDSANEASVKLQSEIKISEKYDPVLEFTARYIVNQWLLAHGQRTIPDGPVSSSIRQELELQKTGNQDGFLVRVADAISGRSRKTRTELIEQNEALAKLNSDAELNLKHSEAALKNNNQIASNLVRDATVEASKIVADANANAANIITSAREHELAVVSSMENKVAAWNDKLCKLEQQSALLQNIAASLVVDPDVFAVYKKLGGDSVALWRLQVSSGIQTMSVLLQKLRSRMEKNNSRLTDISGISEVFKIYIDVVLFSLVQIQNLIDSESIRQSIYLDVANELEINLKGGSLTLFYCLRPKSDGYAEASIYTSFFTDYFRKIMNGKMRPSEVRDLLGAEFASFISSPCAMTPLEFVETFRTISGIVKAAPKV